MTDLVVHWAVNFGFGDEVWAELYKEVGFHLFGGFSGPWVSAHFDLERWAQSLRWKKNEFEMKKTIPEIVVARPETMRPVVMTGEDPSTGRGPAESEVEPERHVETDLKPDLIL